MTASSVLLSARHLHKSYKPPVGFVTALRSATPWPVVTRDIGSPMGGAPAFYAVNDVSLDVTEGETLAIVGESGSGKTTLARLLLRLVEPDAHHQSQEIRFAGRDLLSARGVQLRAIRRQMQMIFQDPFSSLDPRMRVGQIVAEPLEIHEPQLSRTETQAKVSEALTAVGLDSAAMRRFPHEFSGGQRQRIGIARALVLRPKLVVADEPVSALDVSVGAQIIQILKSLQAQLGLTYVIISHSLPVVAQLASTIAVMSAGKLVEIGPAERVLNAPQHPYTQSLLAAVPTLPE
jgi:ABC-type microcin C transport system duplicated ATPase subunit YejF